MIRGKLKIISFWNSWSSYFFSFCLLLGGSIGGIGIKVLSDGLLGGSEGTVWIDMDGRPVDVERADGASSSKFWVTWSKENKRKPRYLWGHIIQKSGFIYGHQ